MFMPFKHEVNGYMADNNDDGINDTAVDIDFVVCRRRRRSMHLGLSMCGRVWLLFGLSNACGRMSVSLCRQNIVNVARIHFYD